MAKKTEIEKIAALKRLEQRGELENPTARRLMVETLLDRGVAIGKIVDKIFDGCYSKMDFFEEARGWLGAISQADPEGSSWTIDDLVRWAMKRRGLSD